MIATQKYLEIFSDTNAQGRYLDMDSRVAVSLIPFSEIEQRMNQKSSSSTLGADAFTLAGKSLILPANTVAVQVVEKNDTPKARVNPVTGKYFVAGGEKRTSGSYQYISVRSELAENAGVDLSKSFPFMRGDKTLSSKTRIPLKALGITPPK